MAYRPISPDYSSLFKPLPNATTPGCHLHVWRPHASTGPVPVFYLLTGRYIHGGAFTAGDAVHGPFRQFRYWLERGIAVVSVEYRLVPHVTITECRQDVLDGYVFLQRGLNGALDALGASFSIDGTRVVAAGASAGGTLCVDLGTDVLALADPAIPIPRAVVPAYPLVDPNTQMTAPRAAYHALAQAEPELYAAAQSLYAEPVSTGFAFTPNRDPSNPRWAWFKATFDTKSHNSFLFACDAPYPPSTDAAAGITRRSPPTFVIVAAADTEIPVVNSYRLRDALDLAGVEVHVAEARDAPHGFTVMMGRYPDREKAEAWWDEAVLPALEWAYGKLGM
ncbi:hypothetical protein Q5752_002717 [Cryptotrichosporon argae]